MKRCIVNRVAGGKANICILKIEKWSFYTLKVIV